VRKADLGQPAPAVGAKGAPKAPAPQGQYPNPEANPHKGGDPPLTFYETLPKGGKAIIGSGLNPVKKESPLPPKPPPALQHPPVREAAQPSAPAKSGERQEPAQAPAPKEPGKAGKFFCVQVASTKERKEAESLKARLTEKGFPAFIVESTLKDRGTWFRVRVGKHLSHEAAGGLAAKAGKGAIVVPE
jgi:cell division protein FtsN